MFIVAMDFFKRDLYWASLANFSRTVALLIVFNDYEAMRCTHPFIFGNKGNYSSSHMKKYPR